MHSDTGVSAQAATAVGLAAGEADLAADGGATGAAQLPAPAPRPASPGGSSEAEGGSEAGSISNSEEEDVGPQPADSLRRRRVSAERGGKPPLQLTPEAVACSAFIDLQHPITLYEGIKLVLMAPVVVFKAREGAETRQCSFQRQTAAGGGALDCLIDQTWRLPTHLTSPLAPGAAAGRGCAIRVGHPVAAYAGPQAADAHASLQAGGVSAASQLGIRVGAPVQSAALPWEGARRER